VLYDNTIVNTATKTDYAWNTVGTIAQNAVSPLLLLVVTRINGIHVSGMFSFAFAVSVVFWSIGMWGGRTFQTSDTRNVFSHQSYITARILLGGVMLVGALLFSLLSGYEVTKTCLILILVAFKALESIADAIYGVMQVHGQLQLVGKSLASKAIAGTILFTLSDLITNNLIGSCSIILVVTSLVLWFYDIPNARKVEDVSLIPPTIKPYIAQARVILWHTFPTLAASLLIMLPINIPRYFLDRYHPGELGYFGIIAMLVTVLALFVTLLLQPTVVHLSRLHASKDYASLNRQVFKLSLLLLCIGIMCVPLTYLAGAPLLGLLFGIDFSGYRLVLVVAIVGGIANSLSLIFITVLTIIRLFKAQLYILFVTNIGLAGLSGFIVEAHRSQGAIFAFAATSCLQAILLILYYTNELGSTLSHVKEN